MKYPAENRNIVYLKKLIAVLPDKPGIYQYYDSTGKIIYVGKAKHLKRRVSSYFTKRHEHRKTALLVRNIVDIKHMVVDTEEDALLLENNLIKKYQPRYNVRLKDDKTFPWLCIKNEPFPRVFKTRNVIRDGSKYFGPYTSYVTVNALLGILKKFYKLRNCNFKLTDQNIKNKKFKVCLEYHIGNCLGACEGFESLEKYNSKIDEIQHILKGNMTGVIDYLNENLAQSVKILQFEEAQSIKEKLLAFKRYQSRSTVVSSSITDVDVFTIVEDEKFAFVNYLKVIKGAIIQTYTTEIKKELEEKSEELLLLAIVDIRQKIFSNAAEILVPIPIKTQLKNVVFKVPKQGDKKKLLDLSQRNATYYKLEKQKQTALAQPLKNTNRILERIQKDFQLKSLPRRIECFDNSNLQGSNPVAACVVFINGKPLKREYRHFNIKTVTGPDDFASMEEVIFRRYKRQQEEGGQLPQLIVVDGGKGQLSAAVEALNKLNLRGEIAIIGIAKRLEEIYFPGDSVPIYLDKTSETLKVVQQLRDEAHRFGINFHRQKRSNEFISSELENIKGIGALTAKKLLLKYKSVATVKTVSEEELAKLIGFSKASIVINYFHSEN